MLVEHPGRRRNWPSRSRCTSIGRAGHELRPLRSSTRGRIRRATVVLDHSGAATVAANVETVLGDGAVADPDQRAGLGRRAVHVAAHGALLGRDAGYRAHRGHPGRRGGPAQPDGAVRRPGWHRRAVRAVLLRRRPAPGVPALRRPRDAELPSNVVYKSVLDGDTARTVWIGDVRIRPAAAGTGTYELNRNLLLTDGARADSVPNLEIETGEIAGAGHASATGRFDDLQLFYLQSRGIPGRGGPPAGGARLLRRGDRPRSTVAGAARPADGQHRRPAGWRSRADRRTS